MNYISKIFALAPNSHSKGFAFLEAQEKREVPEIAPEKSTFKYTHPFLTKTNKNVASYKCLYFAIARWLCNKIISNRVHCSFNYVIAFIHFKRPEIIKAFVIQSFK